MGNDGGSIPTRRELVKEAARNPTTTEIKAAQQEQESHRWSTCPLSNKPLSRPIVSDCNGKLYNKDAVLEYLLPADDEDPNAAVRKVEQSENVLRGSIKSLRDVVEVKFETDKDDAGKERKAEDGREIWVCPITREPLGPGSKAVYLVPCGHAFRGTAIKEAGGDRMCLECNTAYETRDIISIIPTSEEDITKLDERNKTLHASGLTHSLKKAPGGKKRKKGADAANGSDEKASDSSGSKEKKKRTEAKSSDGIKNSATASLTAKVLAEQEEKNKRRKMENNDNLNSLFSNKDPAKGLNKNTDFMNRGFEIPAQARR
ncbi:Rtf2 RING-finger-domain-containing protein [Phyllosticta citribraziliensis]|uniref:Rtf2 RING-finger-domain-containing protein n=1 Tax=Phyllosticta citribraziliensis TaxID=989973 RepID=A0ABR1LFQ3_9PEZI